LLITEGPHADTQDLQLPVFRWFNRFLKGEQPVVEMAATKFFQPQQLRVFDKLPADAVNTNIQSLFVPKAKSLSAGEVKSQRESLLATLKEKSFGGWPGEDTALEPKQVFSTERDGLRFSAWDFTSQHDVRLRLYFLELASGKNSPGVVKLNVMDEAGWKNWLPGIRGGFESQLKEEAALKNAAAGDAESFARLKTIFEVKPRNPASAVAEPPVNYAAYAFFAPRGVGLTAWSGNEQRQISIRRRFMLLGQTLDGMRVWDIRRAVQLIHFVREADAAKVDVSASGVMGFNARTATLFERGARFLPSKEMLLPNGSEPDYLNGQRFVNVNALSQ
jgi:hypothetical protein